MCFQLCLEHNSRKSSRQFPENQVLESEDEFLWLTNAPNWTYANLRRNRELRKYECEYIRRKNPSTLEGETCLVATVQVDVRYQSSPQLPKVRGW